MIRLLRVILLLYLWAGTPSLRAQEPARVPGISNDTRSISITATETVTSQADAATVHVGFLLFGPTYEAAYASATEASNAILAALEKSGIAERSIQSDTQLLGATEFYKLQTMAPQERTAHSFTAQQTWNVRVPASEASHVLDTAVRAGANASGQIDWSLEDASSAESHALTLAIEHARRQAEKIASGLGAHLGKLLYASNQIASQPLPAFTVNGNPNSLFGSPAAADAVQAVPLQIRSREIQTSATVYTVFALE